ncbi:MAG: IS1380 family transposase [Acidiferrobacterales bacterium]|nr:IS1380 family transposase [Acidiferrobacterales bacterium]
MKRFILERSGTEFYTSHSGLALVGQALKHYTNLQKRARTIPKRHGIPNIELIRTFTGLLCLGKSDFEAVENARRDRYFREALGIKQMPSSARLRQRFDEDAQALIPLLDEASVDFLAGSEAPITPLATGHVALDMDVFPMDNSKTAKEGVSHTYKGHDGYTPIAAYLGGEGWCLGCELREGSQHAQKEFDQVLERIVPRARRLTDAPLLLRLDSAHDALANRAWLTNEGVDYLIKWNPRGENPDGWVARFDEAKCWTAVREGKRVGIFSETVEEQTPTEKSPRKVRRVLRLTERTIDRHGQALLLPQYTLEGWWTSLSDTTASDAEIIALYRDHAIAEQFHSEFKTDLDIERLPSGKFDTNDLVLAHATLAYNILRWIGLMGLMNEDSPIRHKAKRRRLRTVIQELMYLAARMIASGRRLKLRFSEHCSGFASFARVYHRLAAG